MKNTDKVVIGVTAALGAIFFGVKLAARIQKKQNVNDKKNPFEGKKVVFIEDASKPENADGMRGYLQAVGETQFELSFYDKYVKRGIDIVLSFGGIIVLSPILLGIALAIKIDDPGPVFFTQKRLGQNKKYFRVYKFRSMKMSTPHDTPTHMLDDPDQYITKVGKILRAHSLDELPQLFNVLDGSLSLVGPRPGLWNQDILTAERDKYGVNEMKPGITGWAQINGRDSISIEEKAKLDGYWKEHESLLFDLKCLIGTIKKVRYDEAVIEGGTGSLRKEEKMPNIGKCSKKLDLSEKKNIIIAGESAYIGVKFKEFMSSYDNYMIESFSTRNDNWKQLDFSKYDVVYYVAGIAHIKETAENRNLYYEVNRDLAVAVAEKAKREGIKQFVYLSSMSVYGLTVGKINENTIVNPRNTYGKSKLEAEQLLWKLKDENFVVSIVRPPMVYGYGCKGNYQKLKSYILKIGILPKYINERSMIYIDNLSSAVRGIIHNGRSGIFFPQNVQYVNTTNLICNIALNNNKKIINIRMIKPLIALATKKIEYVQKIFGTLVYDQKLNVPESWIIEKNFEETIMFTEIPKIKMHDIKIPRRILVLLSAYNGEKYLGQQIESIMNQSGLEEVDVLIRDDGSKDNTKRVIYEYIQKYPNRINVIYGENLGYNRSFFELVNVADGYDYYAFCDQDDVWLPDKLRIACEWLEKENPNLPLLYASTSFLVEDDLKPYGITRTRHRVFSIYNTIIQNICPGHTQVFNGELLKIIKNKVDAEKIYVYDSWITNMAILYGKVYFDEQPHTYYRQHRGNQLGAGANMFSQLLTSAKRIKKGDGLKYRQQIIYFLECNSEELKQQGIFEEIAKFVNADTFYKKCIYLPTSKLYRQKWHETIAFRLAVLFGKY